MYEPDTYHPHVVLDPHASLPLSIDRRESSAECDPAAMRSGLTRAQLDTLDTMEAFRWRLAFVRWPVFKAAIPVLFDHTGKRYVVINEDGSIDAHPTLTLRG